MKLTDYPTELPPTLGIHAIRYLDDLESAVYEGDTIRLKRQTDRLLRVAAHRSVPRLLGLIKRLGKSADTCDLGLSLETIDAIRSIFSDLDAGGINSPELPGMDHMFS